MAKKPMFIDFGQDRGRIRFTRKEVWAIFLFVSGVATHIVRTEIQLIEVKAALTQCQTTNEKLDKRIQELEKLTRSLMPGSNPGAGASGPPPTKEYFHDGRQ